MTIDLDSTICETYGMAKEGARHHGYTGARGYHLLLATAASTGDVLMARLPEGRAHTARGAAHFLRETVGRVRYGGASGQLTVRAESGFYAHTVVVACREMDDRFSITVRQHASLRDPTEAIPEEDWTPIPYWMDRDHQDPQAAGFRSCGTDTRPARRLTLHLPRAVPGKPSSVAPWPGCKPFHSRREGQPATDPTSLQTRTTPVLGSSLLRILSPSRVSQLPQTAIGTLCGD